MHSGEGVEGGGEGGSGGNKGGGSSFRGGTSGIGFICCVIGSWECVAGGFCCVRCCIGVTVWYANITVVTSVGCATFDLTRVSAFGTTISGISLGPHNTSGGLSGGNECNNSEEFHLFGVFNLLIPH